MRLTEETSGLALVLCRRWAQSMDWQSAVTGTIPKTPKSRPLKWMVRVWLDACSLPVSASRGLAGQSQLFGYYSSCLCLCPSFLALALSLCMLHLLSSVNANSMAATATSWPIFALSFSACLSLRVRAAARHARAGIDKNGNQKLR